MFIVSRKYLHIETHTTAIIFHSPNSGAAWEEAFLKAVGDAEDGGTFQHISTARFASRTLELEFEANTQTVIPYFASTFTFMALFSVITCMMTDWVRSKPWLGLLGNISAGMATVSAFGLCCYLGIDFIGINLAAPFLMIGKFNARVSYNVILVVGVCMRIWIVANDRMTDRYASERAATLAGKNQFGQDYFGCC